MDRSPILIYDPEGGIGIPGEPPIPANVPVYSQAGTTPLIQGQAYVDVVFGSIQTTDEWVLVECVVVNEIDVDPLNIWPGIITDKTTSGFRIYLNGLPDSGNYYLHWAVSGVNIASTPANTYYLSAPVGATFTVRLPPSTTLLSPVTITPNDGGAGGTFDVPSVVLSSASASATFTYTPAGYGVVTISTTNSSTLIDPAGVVFNVTMPTYTLSGPGTGTYGVASGDFTVALSGAVVGTVHVTPSAGGGGGTFTPSSVALTTGTPSATFIYTPVSGGTKTISVTNDQGLTNPGNLTYVVTAPTYTFSGPSSGAISVASSNFTVTLPVGVIGTVHVTPADAGAGGTFTPTSLALTAGGSGTFTYTPVTSGARTISVTNDGGLINPANLTYTVTLAPLADGASVSNWLDSSPNGHTATQTGTARPIFKTNIVNGKPVVRFTSAASQSMVITSPIPDTNTFTVIVVMAGADATTAKQMNSVASSTAGTPTGPLLHPNHNRYASGWGATLVSAGTWGDTAFHVLTSGTLNTSSFVFYVDGTSVTPVFVANVSNGSFDRIGFRNPTEYSDGDIAEIVIYNVLLSGTDRANIEKYLGTKYGITVAGGTAAQPDTVGGLQAWWKADSL